MQFTEGNEYRIVFEYMLQLFGYQNKTNSASLAQTPAVHAVHLSSTLIRAQTAAVHTVHLSARESYQLVRGQPCTVRRRHATIHHAQGRQL